jgi:hypothetical protein
MEDLTDEPLAESERMLRQAVAALDSAESALLDIEIEPYRYPDWSQCDDLTSPSPSHSASQRTDAGTSVCGLPDTNGLWAPSGSQGEHSQTEELRIELGRTKIPLKDLYELSENALLLLNVAEGELVDLYAGDARLAKGEVLCFEGRICFRVVELIDQRTYLP